MRIFKKWWFWLIIVLIFFIAVYNSGNGNGDLSKNNTQLAPNTTQAGTLTTQSPVTATPTPVTATPTPADQSIKEGMYKVGKDIAIGEYLLTSKADAYFQVSKDSTGSLNSIITNDNFRGTRYVTVTDGQYIELRNSTMLPVEKAPVQQPKDGKYPQGMYKEGRDITAGEYIAIPDVSGQSSYLEVSKDSYGGLESIISNDNFTSQKYITIGSGQYIKLVDCYLTK